MKTIAGWIVFSILLVPAISRAAAPPDHLTLNDLANHPDRWPDTIKVNRAFRFQGGPNISSGASLLIDSVNGSQVTVEPPDHSVQFDIAATDCDLLDAANAAWTKLTPAQRAIDPDSLPKDRSIWPELVKMRIDLGFTNGVQVPAGTECTVMSITPQEIGLAVPHKVQSFTAGFGDSDLIARARALALLDPANRPARMADSLKGNMLDAAGKQFSDDHMADKQLYLLYFGGKRCPRCVQVSPALAKELNDLQPKFPKLQVVLIGEDEDTKVMLQFMNDEKLPWPAVSFQAINTECPQLYEYTKGGGLLPELVITDRFGNVLADSDDHNGHYDPDVFLQKLPKVFETLTASHP